MSRATPPETKRGERPFMSFQLRQTAEYVRLGGNLWALWLNFWARNRFPFFILSALEPGFRCSETQPVVILRSRFYPVIGCWLRRKNRSQIGKMVPSSPPPCGVHGSVRLHRPTFSTDTLLADVWGTRCLAVCSQLPSDRHFESHNLRGHHSSSPQA